MSVSVYESVTNQIIEQLEKGTVPWVRPWKVRPAYNTITQKPYRGINQLLLWSRPYSQFAYLTYKQARELGGYVKKGEKSNWVTYFGKAKKKGGQAEDEEEDDMYFFLKYYYVFNIIQCDELPQHLYITYQDPPAEDLYDHVEAFVDSLGANLQHGGNKAFYRPSEDFVQMPVKGTFESMEHYYATMLHEHIHWTGAKHRLNRDLCGIGNEQYAFEELIAELGSAFLCSHLGIKGQLRHTDYLGSWIRELKSDQRAFLRAASKAQQAVDYLREKAGERTEEEDCDDRQGNPRHAFEAARCVS